MRCLSTPPPPPKNLFSGPGAWLLMIAAACLPAATSLTAAGAAEPAGDLPGSIRVAAVQIIPGASGQSPAADVLSYIERAAADDVDLIVFPEYHLGRIAVPGTETDKVAEAAAAFSIYVIVGAIEVLHDGRFFNSALLFNPGGEIAGNYHKTHAAVGEPPHFWPARGDELEADMEVGQTLPVFETSFGTVGIFTCYDGYFPEVPNALSLQGAEVLVWINGRAGEVEDFMLRTIVYQTYTAIIATNTAHGHGTAVATFPASILARSNEPAQSYISTTIDLASLRNFRKNSRVFHQRRPDLYQTLVEDLRPQDRYR